MKKILFTCVLVFASVTNASAGCLGEGEADTFYLAYQKAIGNAYATCGTGSCNEECSVTREVGDVWVVESKGDYFKVGIRYDVGCFYPF